MTRSGSRSGGADRRTTTSRAFPSEARREAGYQLHLVQQGQDPYDWKTMPTVGPGTIEIRIHTAT